MKRRLEFDSTAAVRPRLLFTAVPQAVAVVRTGSTGTRPAHNMEVLEC